jgi:hypothetical protein
VPQKPTAESFLAWFDKLTTLSNIEGRAMGERTRRVLLYVAITIVFIAIDAS